MRGYTLRRALPAGALAQRALHWDHVEVTSHLDAEGRLIVAEARLIWGLG